MIRLRIPEHRKSVEFQRREKAVEEKPEAVCLLVECQGSGFRVGHSRRRKSVIQLPENLR
jgi:hypothetical protein